MKDDFIEFPTDASMMNESMLNEFLFESMPQLLLQGLNSTMTNQWGSGFAIFSFTFSLVVVINATWRFGYYYFVEDVPIGDVPVTLKIPLTKIKIDLKRRDNDTQESREKKMYKIHGQEHLQKLLKISLIDTYGDISNKISHKREEEASKVVDVIVKYRIIDSKTLATNPKAIHELNQLIPNASLALKRLANNEDIITHLQTFDENVRKEEPKSFFGLF